MYEYVTRFEKNAFGMFVHFGLFSMFAEGEWTEHLKPHDKATYEKSMAKFNPTKTWAKELVSAAKIAGCKYITLTTKHHEGFALYDTCGLSEFDAPHSLCGRDLVKEFVDECNKQGIIPFFYHALLDWHDENYKTDFPKYIDYLCKSVEILCKNYGKIGGLWFDGMWDKFNADWQEDRLYATIRKYQPEAMIINNTGMGAMGKVGHKEIDSVTFERGKPASVSRPDRPIAGEMCQVLNDHWGYAKNDLNYKPVSEIIENLVDCRGCNCNFLLNIGPMGNGKIRGIDKEYLKLIGQWIKANKGFIYNVKKSDIEAENALLLTDGKYHYAVVKNVGICGDGNVTKTGENSIVRIKTDKKIKNAKYLDNGERADIKGGTFAPKLFAYGNNLSVRVVRFELV